LPSLITTLARALEDKRYPQLVVRCCRYIKGALL
jgi:hypothetical protein